VLDGLLMAYNLLGRNVIVRGEFNKAIIHPKWLVEQNIMAEGDVQFLLSDTPGMSRRFKFSGYDWEVGEHRLVVKAEKEIEVDPGPMVGQVLGLLPHTPTIAVGHNFLYELDEFYEALKPHLGSRDCDQLSDYLNGEFRQSESSIVLGTGEGSRVSLRSILEPQNLKVDFNFHFDSSNAREAVPLCGRGDESRLRAEEILDQMIG